MLKLSFLVILTQFAMATAGLGQAMSGPQPASNQIGPTVHDRLIELHVPLTKDGLLSALHSENPEIRSLAIGQLTSDGVKEAIPEIAALMSAESEPLIKIGLAVDLALLGDERGTQTLRQYCSDTSALMIVRLQAVDRLRADVGDQSCPGLVIQGLQDTDSVVREQSMSMIPHFKELSPSESPLVRATLIKLLSDIDPFIRRRASRTIWILGDASAIPALNAAVTRETDPAVRAYMARSLKGLQEKQQ